MTNSITQFHYTKVKHQKSRNVYNICCQKDVQLLYLQPLVCLRTLIGNQFTKIRWKV